MNMQNRLVVFALACLVKSAVMVNAAMELTPATFDEATSGKNAFIKFLAPW